MKRFATGFLAGVAATIAGAMVFVLIWKSPTLDVTADIPAAARLHEAFEVRVALANPHDKTARVGNIDLPDSVLESFSVKVLAPRPADDSPVEGFGSRTWHFDLEVPPMATESILLELTPTRAGRQVIDFEVCNATEDCSQIVRAIEVL